MLVIKTVEKFVRKIEARVLVLTVTPHAHCQTFLEAAVLTTITVMFGDFAVLISSALISQLFANGSLKEAFATLATNGSIVSSCN